MTRLLSYALVSLVSLGLAYAVAMAASRSIGASLSQSAALIDHAGSGR